MADRRKDLELVITTRNQTQAGLKQAEAGLQQFTRRVDAVSNALSVLGAGTVFRGLTDGINRATEAFTRLRNSTLGAQTVAARMGESISDVNALIDELTSDGLMGFADAATSVKNLMATHFDLEQTRDLMLAFKDSAAFGRQAALGFGESIRGATEGVKNGNSILVDNAGITKNLSNMLVDAGYAATDLSKAADDVNIRMAIYNGIMKEAGLFQGDAAKLAGELSGAQARTAMESEKLAAALGGTLAPALTIVHEEGGEWLKTIRGWIEVNPMAARSLTLMAGGLLGSVAAMTATIGTVNLLRIAVTGLTASLGPIGLLLAGVTAAAGAIGGLTLAAQAEAREQQNLRSETVDLMRQYEALRKVLDDNTSSTDKKERASSRLKDVLSQLFELQPQMRSWFDEEGRLLDSATAGWNRFYDAAVKLEKFQLEGSIAEQQKTLNQGKKDLAKMREELWAPYQKAIDQERIRAGDAAAAALEKDLLERFGSQLEEKLQKKAREVAALELELEKNQARLSYLNAPMPEDEALPPPPPKDDGSGAGSPKKDPYQEAIRYVQFLRNTSQITAQQEIAMLEQVKATHAKTAEQQMDIDERLYNARQKLSDQEKQDAEADRKAKVDAAIRWLDFGIRMGQISTQEEVARLDEIMATYELTEEEMMSLLERRQGTMDRLNQAQANSEEERIRNDLARINHSKQMGEISREEETAALEAHLEQEKDYYDKHIDERWAIEERLYSLREEAREEDLRKEQEAAEKAAKDREEAEREAASAIQQLRRSLSAAEKKDLDDLRKSQSEGEERQQRKIDGLRRELELLDRRNQAEDRALKLEELRRRLKEAEASGPLEKFIAEDGSVTWRNRQAEDLASELADAEREAEREAERLRLQDEIDREQERLDHMRQHHQDVYAERQQAWTDLLALDDEQLLALVTETDTMMGEDGWYGTIARWLSQAVTTAEEKATAIRTALTTALKEVKRAQEAVNSLNSGAASSPPAVIPPTLPAIATAAAGFAMGALTIINNVTGATDPEATADAVGKKTEDAVGSAIDYAGLARGASLGKRL